MRRHGVGMWIVVNEEFHDDPLTQFVAPPRPYAGNRDLFVFVDAGPAGLARHAVTGFWEEALSRYFETDRDPKPWDQAMKALYEKYRPRTIALSIDGKRGVTRSLTKTTHDALAEAMGPEAKARFVPAEPLIEEYLGHPASRGGAGVPEDGRAHRSARPARAVRRGDPPGDHPGGRRPTLALRPRLGSRGRASGSSPTSGCSGRGRLRTCPAASSPSPTRT